MRLPALLRPHGRHRAPTAPYQATEINPGLRHLVCDSPVCRHLHPPHAPRTDGTWLCLGCGLTKGDQ